MPKKQANEIGPPGAVLTGDELAEIRRALAALGTVNFTKAQVNQALQAVEDYFENTARAGLGQAIEAATPGVFNATWKKRIVGYWLMQKFRRESI